MSKDTPAMYTLEKLKELAANATPGPWTATRWRHKNDWRVDSESIHALVELRGPDTSANTRVGDDASFIAAFNPQVVQALLACAEAMLPGCEPGCGCEVGKALAALKEAGVALG